MNDAKYHGQLPLQHRAKHHLNLGNRKVWRFQRFKDKLSQLVEPRTPVKPSSRSSSPGKSNVVLSCNFRDSRIHAMFSTATTPYQSTWTVTDRPSMDVNPRFTYNVAKLPRLMTTLFRRGDIPTHTRSIKILLHAKLSRVGAWAGQCRMSCDSSDSAYLRPPYHPEATKRQRL